MPLGVISRNRQRQYNRSTIGRPFSLALLHSGEDVGSIANPCTANFWHAAND